MGGLRQEAVRRTEGRLRLSRYTHRVAISNSRLIALDAAGVTFKWKDYRARSKVPGNAWIKPMTLDPAEFIRRFLLHVLPNGFHRIRHYGLFAGTVRRRNIERARQALAASEDAPQVLRRGRHGSHEMSPRSAAQARLSQSPAFRLTRDGTNAAAKMTDGKQIGRKTRVFFSYSRRDGDKTDILPGEAWRARLERMVIAADVVLVCLSPDSITSTEVSNEIETARSAFRNDSCQSCCVHSMDRRLPRSRASTISS